MKKTYNQPECIVVQLGTCKMIAESLAISSSSSDAITDGSQILTKENKDVNLWDNEW